MSANTPVRVLVVDDSRDIADSTAMVLRLGGFAVRACYGGAEALAEAEGFRPQVCLLDFNMPGMDGDELALRLRTLLGGGAVLVAVTAARGAEAERRLAAAGFAGRLVKPADPAELLAVGRLAA